jgi:hypothetical protein
MTSGQNWISFLRQFGPSARNGSSYDERITRAASRLQVRPISFEHPLEAAILGCLSEEAPRPTSIVLTGNAGDGKSHLCRKAWAAIGGDPKEWDSDVAYFETTARVAGKMVDVAFLRDLTALIEPDPLGRYQTKSELLLSVSRSLLDPNPDKIYVVAANDGQLIESWRQASRGELTERTQNLLEACLMGDTRPEPSSSLSFFNLSAVPCATILDLVANAVLTHEGWDACRQEATQDGFFGPRCPIRHNLELLQSEPIMSRLRALFDLCQFSELHTPIRRVFMLISNALLGHPDVRDALMRPADIRRLIAADTVSKANLYANLFGGNLSATRRQSLEIFDYLNRFGIGFETTNRLDNILIFGTQDDNLKPYFESLVASDAFYGATDGYRAAQANYLESPNRTSDSRDHFIRLLADQRRALFFTIPENRANELDLWRLTVFANAGEYLQQVARALEKGERVQRNIISKMVNGLNRVFTGLLVTTNRELLLATSLSNSESRISQLLEERISVSKRRDECVDISLKNGLPSLDVHFAEGFVQSLTLNLVRYEFLCRVADGALPGSFSRECYEDILAFKSALLSMLNKVRGETPQDEEPTFRLLTVDPLGNPVDEVVELFDA